MDITFKSSRLRKTLCNEKEINRKYGKLAKAIQARMAFLYATPTLNDVPVQAPFYRHELKGDRKGQFAVWLDENNRLVFEPDHDPLPRKEDGGLDLKKITAVKILVVEDYHR